jgi:hypothetical protein
MLLTRWHTSVAPSFEAGNSAGLGLGETVCHIFVNYFNWLKIPRPRALAIASSIVGNLWALCGLYPAVENCVHDT